MKYAAKKIVWMLLTMVIVSFLAFLAFRIIPGDPTAKLLGEQATPERVEALRQEGYVVRNAPSRKYVTGAGAGPPVSGAVRQLAGGFRPGGHGLVVQLQYAGEPDAAGENSRDGAFDPAVVSADRGAVHPAGAVHRPPQRRGAG